VIFDRNEIVDPSGAYIGRSPLPSLAGGRMLSGGTRVFARALYDVATGTKLWPTDGSFVQGAANDTRVIYADGVSIKVADLP
jgi:hypothetical protein